MDILKNKLTQFLSDPAKVIVKLITKLHPSCVVFIWFWKINKKSAKVIFIVTAYFKARTNKNYILKNKLLYMYNLKNKFFVLLDKFS